MQKENELPVEERIVRLLEHLGIKRAHFAARVPTDFTGLASVHPEVVSSLTLVCPPGTGGDVLSAVAPRLLVFTGPVISASMLTPQTAAQNRSPADQGFHPFSNPFIGFIQSENSLRACLNDDIAYDASQAKSRRFENGIKFLLGALSAAWSNKHIEVRKFGFDTFIRLRNYVLDEK